MPLNLFILFVLYFLLCQFLVEKNHIPKEIMDLTPWKLVWLGILCICLSAIIGVFLHSASIIVPLVTIPVASIIAGKYRQIFNDMEKGKKI